MRAPFLLPILTSLACLAQDPIFRSGVSVVRLDVQVLNRNQAVNGLTREDFIVREEGANQAVRYFGAESLPLDILLLLDVSGSMAPQVSRVVEQAHSALGVLRPGDRVAIMVFDRETRLRLPLESNIDKIREGLDETVHRENFRGGTDIHFGLYEAAKYLRAEARRDARRAVIILTDDQTERARKDALVLRGFGQAEAVLCALVVEAKKNRRTDPGGVEQLAAQTGGDSFRSKDVAEHVRTTLERLRRRYLLGFHLPESLTPGSSRNVEVTLTPEAKRRNAGAQIQSRRTYIVPDPVTAPPAN